MTKEHFLSHSCTVTFSTERIEFDKESAKRKRSFEGSLAPLPYYSTPKDKDRQVTRHITCKMAESGLVYQDLVEIYEKKGEEGLEGVLKERQENGKPRVTKDRRIINTIFNHFKHKKNIET